MKRTQEPIHPSQSVKAKLVKEEDNDETIPKALTIDVEHKCDLCDKNFKTESKKESSDSQSSMLSSPHFHYKDVTNYRLETFENSLDEIDSLISEIEEKGVQILTFLIEDQYDFSGQECERVTVDFGIVGKIPLSHDCYEFSKTKFKGTKAQSAPVEAKQKCKICGRNPMTQRRPNKKPESSLTEHVHLMDVKNMQIQFPDGTSFKDVHNVIELMEFADVEIVQYRIEKIWDFSKQTSRGIKFDFMVSEKFNPNAILNVVRERFEKTIRQMNESLISIGEEKVYPQLNSEDENEDSDDDDNESDSFSNNSSKDGGEEDDDEE